MDLQGKILRLLFGSRDLRLGNSEKVFDVKKLSLGETFDIQR
jgi:hypothetical protein